MPGFLLKSQIHVCYYFNTIVCGSPRVINRTCMSGVVSSIGSHEKITCESPVGISATPWGVTSVITR